MQLRAHGGHAWVHSTGGVESAHWEERGEGTVEGAQRVRSGVDGKVGVLARNSHEGKKVTFHNGLVLGGERKRNKLFFLPPAPW